MANLYLGTSPLLYPHVLYCHEIEWEYSWSKKGYVCDNVHGCWPNQHPHSKKLNLSSIVENSGHESFRVKSQQMYPPSIPSMPLDKMPKTKRAKWRKMQTTLYMQLHGILARQTNLHQVNVIIRAETHPCILLFSSWNFHIVLNSLTHLFIYPPHWRYGLNGSYERQAIQR